MNANLTMTEEQIIEGCKSQKREAQKALYEAHARTMYGICLRYSADEHAAKDLLQDGFMKVFASIGSFEGRGSFEGWMKRIFVNLALERIRKRKLVNLNEPEDIQNLAEELPDETENSKADNISVEELLRMVQSLPEGYATVFNLYAVENYSHKEIADMLGISEGTSRSQYLRARQSLQVMVNEYLKENM